jgi:4-diphosphocytidyl-2-C-methyl-D-erythritol kinase
VRLRTEAPGKVNLCLRLGPTRADGRHELVTVFESVALSDTLTLTTTDAGRDLVSCPGVEGPNLVDSALSELRRAGWDGPRVAIEVCKRVPVAAGMGGGSGDAAAALRLARALGGLDDGLVVEVAARLGADVPAALTPGVALGLGAGERVEQAAPLHPHAFAIVPLPAALSTPAVYHEADRLGLPRPAAELALARDEIAGWLRHGARLPDRLLVNDLEPAARSLCPLVDDGLASLRRAGADAAFVSGSGPTCVGLWWGDQALGAARAAVASLTHRFPRSVAVPPASPESGFVLSGC